MKVNIFLLLFCSVVLMITPVGAKTTLGEIEKELMCPCEDNCGKMLSNCTCKFSDEMRIHINGELKNGLNKEQIISAYVEKYGEKVLSAPTKKGFNLTVWTIPFIALLLGGWGVQRVMVKWVAKGKNNKVGSNPNLPQQDLSEKNSAQNLKNILDDELNKFE